MTNQIKTKLRDQGLSVTTCRLDVFTHLQTRGATTIGELIATMTPPHDRASIYRTLSLFKNLGVTRQVVIGGKRKIELGDQYSRHHHHLSCTVCEKVVSVVDSKLEQILHELAERYQFVETSHSVELDGICSDCR